MSIITAAVHQILLGDKIKQDGIDWKCGTYWGRTEVGRAFW